jgi:hypothetical protein
VTVWLGSPGRADLALAYQPRLSASSEHSPRPADSSQPLGSLQIPSGPVVRLAYRKRRIKVRIVGSRIRTAVIPVPLQKVPQVARPARAAQEAFVTTVASRHS